MEVNNKLSGRDKLDDRVFHLVSFCTASGPTLHPTNRVVYLFNWNENDVRKNNYFIVCTQEY